MPAACMWGEGAGGGGVADTTLYQPHHPEPTLIFLAIITITHLLTTSIFKPTDVRTEGNKSAISESQPLLGLLGITFATKARECEFYMIR